MAVRQYARGLARAEALQVCALSCRKKGLSCVWLGACLVSGLSVTGRVDAEGDLWALHFGVHTPAVDRLLGLRDLVAA